MTSRGNKRRLTLSVITLAAFLLFSVLDNIILKSGMSYDSYRWRMGVVNDIILLIPVASLLVFSLCERRFESIKGRAYVIAVFALYAVWFVCELIMGDFYTVSFFNADLLSGRNEAVVLLVVGRLVMLILSPFISKGWFRLYCGVMITATALLACATLYAACTVNVTGLRYFFAFTVDALFHVTLYSFDELMQKDRPSGNFDFDYPED